MKNSSTSQWMSASTSSTLGRTHSSPTEAPMSATSPGGKCSMSCTRYRTTVKPMTASMRCMVPESTKARRASMAIRASTCLGGTASSRRDGGHVVQDGGHDGGEPSQGEEQPPGIAPCPLGDHDGGVLKKAGLLEDAHDDHHPQEQPDGVEVDGGDGCLPVIKPQADPGRDHGHCPGHGGDGAVHPLREDQAIGKEEDRTGGYHWARVHVPSIRPLEVAPKHGMACPLPAAVVN